MPARKHNFTVVEIKAGIMVIVSAAVLVLFVMVIGGTRPQEEALTYYAFFKDTAGLNKGADVRFGGSKAGRVTEIALEPNDHSLVRVQATVKKGTPVNAKSMAYISQTTLTAEKHLEISTGEKDAGVLKDGSEIPTQAGGLFEQAGAVASSVQEVIEDVRDLLGIDKAKEKETKGEGTFVTVADIAESVGKVADRGADLVTNVQDVIGENRDDLNAILTKAQEIETSAKDLIGTLQDILGENRGDLRATIEGLRTLATKVGEMSGKLEGLVNTLQATLDNAKALSGGAQQLLEANRPVIEEMLLDLREAVRQLKSFARTMAEQPEAIIRGKAPEGRK